MERIKIGIADDEALFRKGMKLILNELEINFRILFS